MGALYHVGARHAIAFYMRIAWLLFMFSGYGRTVSNEPLPRLFFGPGVGSINAGMRGIGLWITVAYQGSGKLVGDLETGCIV